MRPYYITESFLHKFISNALAEDAGDGDHSTLATIPEEMEGQARLIVKENGVLAGTELALAIFHHYDDQLHIEEMIKDGAGVANSDIAFVVHGRVRSILTTERLVLNCMQRMSGIATLTNRLVKIIEGTGAQVMDTRKTTPNFRLLEKWAVVIGGGMNHRIGLFDMIMLKDNHIDAAGGPEKAIIAAKDYLRASKRDLKIEIEARTLDEVKRILGIGGVHVIMLDNMNLDEMSAAVNLIAGRCKVEASGGITEQTIRRVAECGVDFISIGALTHSVKSLDLSLKILD